MSPSLYVPLESPISAIASGGLELRMATAQKGLARAPLIGVPSLRLTTQSDPLTIVIFISRPHRR